MVPQHCRARTRRLTVVAVAVALSATLASGVGFAGTPPDPQPPTPAAPGQPVPAVTEPAAQSAPQEPAPAPSPQEPAATPDPTSPPLLEPPQPAPTASAIGPETPAPDEESPAFGAFLDSGTPGVAGMTRLSRWLGGADLRVGHSYLPGDRWSNIEGAPDFLDGWARWRRAKDDRMFVLNVPMLERNEEGVSDDEVGWLLREGAAGTLRSPLPRPRRAAGGVGRAGHGPGARLGNERHDLHASLRARPGGLEEVLGQHRDRHAFGAGPRIPVRFHAEPRPGRHSLDGVLSGGRQRRHHRHGRVRPAARSSVRRAGDGALWASSPRGLRKIPQQAYFLSRMGTLP
ncbi:hypothetical protein SALBM311S_12285 [Streptomyces alboniger]